MSLETLKKRFLYWEDIMFSTYGLSFGFCDTEKQIISKVSKE